MTGSRKQTDVRRDIDRLDLAGRKQTALEDAPTRSPLNGALGVGRDSASSNSSSTSANGIDYEATTVTSTDGIFAFEILVDSTLL